MIKPIKRKRKRKRKRKPKNNLYDLPLIIGNAPTVLNYKFGEEINKFNYVARINNYEITGFENNIGSKTDFWIRTSHSSIKYRPYNLFNKVYLCHIKRINKLNKKLLMGNNVKLITKKHLGSLTDKYLLPKGKRYSTGLFFILWITLYQKIIIHGFDFFNNGRPSLYHYYKQTGNEYSPRRHLGKIEKNIVKDLANQGKIIWLKHLLKKSKGKRYK